VPTLETLRQSSTYDLPLDLSLVTVGNTVSTWVTL